MLDCQFCIHASKEPVIIINQLKSIYNSTFKDSHSHLIHTCFPIIQLVRNPLDWIKTDNYNKILTRDSICGHQKKTRKIGVCVIAYLKFKIVVRQAVVLYISFML